MRIDCRWIVLGVAFPLLPGCGGEGPAGGGPGGRSDPEKARAADISALFVGNSHTRNHDLPELVCRMVRSLQPGKTAYAHVVGVTFLDDVARDPRCREEIDTRPWKFVVLQAQRISQSGRYEYSRAEGIDIAKRARARGATVLFFSEWGLQGVASDGARQEKVYRDMAGAAGAEVVRVGRAWDLALAERPGLPLYEIDGNHQSAVGAFLSAAVLAGRLSGESPAPLAAFPCPGVEGKDRQFLADCAAKALAEEAPNP